MRGRFSAAALRPHQGLALAAFVFVGVGAVHGQVLEVHLDGSVTTYDGAIQHSSRGAHPMARLISPQPSVRHRGRGGGAMAAPPPETAEAIHASAERHQVSEQLVRAVAWRESRFNAKAVSPKGARGTMQLMPATARSLGVDSSDLASNIDGGANYLSRMMHRFNGDTAKALAAYNAGPAAVERYGGVPPYAETRAYVGAILGSLGGPDDALVEASTILKARMGAD